MSWLAEKEPILRMMFRLIALGLLAWLIFAVLQLPRNALESSDLRGIQSDVDKIQRDVQKMREAADKAEYNRHFPNAQPIQAPQFTPHQGAPR